MTPLSTRYQQVVVNLPQWRFGHCRYSCLMIQECFNTYACQLRQWWLWHDHFEYFSSVIWFGWNYFLILFLECSYSWNFEWERCMVKWPIMQFISSVIDWHLRDEEAKVHYLKSVASELETTGCFNCFGFAFKGFCFPCILAVLEFAYWFLFCGEL